MGASTLTGVDEGKKKTPVRNGGGDDCGEKEGKKVESEEGENWSWEGRELERTRQRGRDEVTSVRN